MEVASNEDLLKPETAAPASDLLDDTVAPNHGDTEMKHDVPGKEDSRGILELIASTGKYWQEWDILKAVLSFELKQVLSKYPEAKMTDVEQIGFLGETFAELMKRLDEALCSFDQGPPFTLQRLCEILLDAQGIYPKLSKLARALEKNLLVTSMLTVSSDPYPLSTIEPNKATKESEEHPNSAANRVENVTCGGDNEVSCPHKLPSPATMINSSVNPTSSAKTKTKRNRSQIENEEDQEGKLAEWNLTPPYSEEALLNSLQAAFGGTLGHRKRPLMAIEQFQTYILELIKHLSSWLVLFVCGDVGRARLMDELRDFMLSSSLSNEAKIADLIAQLGASNRELANSIETQRVAQTLVECLELEVRGLTQKIVEKDAELKQKENRNHAQIAEKDKELQTKDDTIKKLFDQLVAQQYEGYYRGRYEILVEYKRGLNSRWDVDGEIKDYARVLTPDQLQILPDFYGK